MKLWNRNFIIMLVGQIISLFGNSILRFALPLYLLNETGSAALFGLVGASAFIPMIFLTPIGGIIADRVNKRNIMVVLDFVTAFVIIAFAISLDKVNIVLLICIVLIILYGIQGAYQPAVQASIPLLLSKDLIMQGNALINLVNSTANLLGPIMGGILFSIVGIEQILLASIICFLASALLEIFIKMPFIKHKNNGNIFKIGFSDLKESMNFMVYENPVFIKICVIIASINMVFTACVMICMPIIITKYLGFELDIANRLYGYAQGVMGAGSLTGGIIASIFARRLKPKNNATILFACGLTLIPIVVALIVPNSSTFSYILILIGGFFMMLLASVFSIVMIGYIQLLTPTHILGKVISCAMCIGMCASPIGQAAYGILFEYMESRPEILIMGACIVVLIIAALSTPVFKKLHMVIAKNIEEFDEMDKKLVQIDE